MLRVSKTTDATQVTIRAVPDRPDVGGRMFHPLADAGISIDTIVQTSSLEGRSECPVGHVLWGDIPKLAQPTALARR